MPEKRECAPVPRGSEGAIADYLDGSNENPRPFVWTKAADEIRNNVKRFCLRTSGTGH